MLSNTAIPREYGKFRDAVMSGDIPVCETISLQMNRIDEMITDPRYYYDDKAIDGFIKFVENECTLTDGSPVKMLPSFKLWAEDLLAWYEFVEEKVYNPDLQRYEVVVKKKRVRNVQYLIVSRGSAKSMYVSFLHQYGLVVDSMSTHQITTAPTMKQAEEVMQPIRTAIAMSHGPLYKFLTQGNIHSTGVKKTGLASTKLGIQNFITNSLLEIRPMSIDKLQGLRVKYATIDEWLSGKLKENVMGAIEQSASKIDDYIILAISSEGTERDGVGDSIKMELYSILNNEFIDPTRSIWHYQMDHISEIAHPELWLKASPNLGITVSYSTYEKDVRRMESVTSERSDILAKRFGIPVEGFTFCFKYEDTIPHSRQNFDGLDCSLGVDLSQGDDFCAFTFLFPLGNGVFGVKTKAYVCRSKVNKLPKAMINKYQTFVDEGTLTIFDSKAVLDMKEVYEDLDEFIIEHEYNVMTLGYDPWNAEYFINRWVTENSGYGVEVVRQGAKTESVPLGEIQNTAAERLLIFDEDLMKFAMGNSIIIQDNNGNMKLDKRRSDEKIDNVAALLDAWVAYSRNKEVFD